MNISPSTATGWLLLDVQVRMDRLRRHEERGASALEFVIISAVLAALAIAVTAIIYNLVTDQADTIDVTPDIGG